MPRVPFDTFSRQIKAGEIAPAIYLWGGEDVLKDEAVRAVLERVVDPGLRDFNYDVRSAAQLDPDAVDRAYRFHRARRAARERRHRERRWASLRFWLVFLLVLAGAAFLAARTLGEIERIFGL